MAKPGRLKIGSYKSSKSVKKHITPKLIRLISDGLPGGQLQLEDEDGNPIELPIESIKWEMASPKDFGRLTIVVSPVELSVEAILDKSNVNIKGTRKTMNLRDFINANKKGDDV